MPDYEIKADTAADMMTTLFGLGLAWNTLVGASVRQVVKGDGVSSSGVRYSINHYGIKKVPTGNILTDARGFKFQETVTQAGDYAIIRWQSANPFPPVGTTLLAGVVIRPIPADSPVVFAS